MQAISESDELELFETDLVVDLIDYKWDRYARSRHIFGFLIHLCYIFIMMDYIRIVYTNRKPYDFLDQRFSSIPPEIRFGMTQEEITYHLNTKHWF